MGDRDHARRLHRAPEGFAAADGNVVLIGQASPRHAAPFRRRLGLELPVLADADRRSYRAAGARCRAALSATPRSSAAPVGELHGDKAVWKLVDREPERFRSRARPRGVNTWEDSAAVRRVLGLGAAGRRGAYPPM